MVAMLLRPQCVKSYLLIGLTNESTPNPQGKILCGSKPSNYMSHPVNKPELGQYHPDAAWFLCYYGMVAAT